MKNFTRNDVRDVYRKLESSGLFYTISCIKRDIEQCKHSNNVYKHTIPSLENVLKLLNELNTKRDDLLKERIVRSGPVNNGESWGDFYDCFIKKDDTIVKEMFNELQKNTSFGFYLEL